MTQQAANIPTGYTAADNGRLASGSPMTAVLPMSQAGLRGVIVPPATAGGIPQGTTPHKMDDIEVTIDPDIDGGTTIRLGDLNRNVIDATVAEISAESPEPADKDARREWNSVVMRSIAGKIKQASTQYQEAPVPQQQFSPQPQPQQFQPQPQQFQPQPQQFQPQPQQQFQPQTLRPSADQSRASAPMHVFGRPPQQAAQPAVEAGGGPPTVQVQFEVEHFGSMPAFYHDVIMCDNFLVLVYDTRHTGSAKYFPQQPQSENTPATAMHIIGTNEAHEIHTTNVQFVHNHYEYCVLIVTRSWSLQ